MNQPFTSSEPQIQDVAVALLTLAPRDRHAAIRTLLAMMERVISEGELHRSGQGACPSVRHRDGTTDVTESKSK